MDQPNQASQPLQDDEQSIQQMQQQIAGTLGITGLPDEKQKEIIERSTDILLQKIFMETVDKLSEEDQKTYLEMIEKEDTDPEETGKFLQDKIPGYKENIQKTVDDFITGLKSAAA
jgi:hypothetical protein